MFVVVWCLALWLWSLVWYVCYVLYGLLYVCVCCFVVCGCAVSRRYIDVFYSDVFSVVNVYLDHLKFCVVCINGRRYVCCGECYVVSDECDESTSCLVQPIVAHCCEVVYFGCFAFRGELGFLYCDDICMGGFPKNGNRTPIAGGERGRHNLHRNCQTTMTAPSRVGCVI